MGYTHHFPRMREVSDEQWERIAGDFALLLEHLPEQVRVFRDEDTDAPPLVDDEKIQFYGGVETFVLNRHSRDRHAGSRPPREEYPFGFDYCKTEHAPYDMLVCATLAVAEDIAPGAWKIASNGKADDWQQALDWASGVLRRRLRFPVM